MQGILEQALKDVNRVSMTDYALGVAKSSLPSFEWGVLGGSAIEGVADHGGTPAYNIIVVPPDTEHNEWAVSLTDLRGSECVTENDTNLNTAFMQIMGTLHAKIKQRLEILNEVLDANGLHIPED